MKERKKKIVVIGGGVAGTTAALTLGKMGYETILFERKRTLVSGPPFCHLHAGGNLYREISDTQCLSLLRQSIEFARLYPFIIDRRPTVVAVPTQDPGDPRDLLPRLEKLRNRYAQLVSQERANAVLGEPKDYFRLFGRKEMERLKQLPLPEHPKNSEEWMIPMAKEVDLDKLKYPLVLVREYGLNLFRLAGGAAAQLERMDTVTLKTGCRVVDVRREKKGFCVTDDTGETTFCDYLINAAGFRTGEIDDMLGLRIRRMVEFKAAYTAIWRRRHAFWPEVIFHGERGTPKGMGQFTPYAGGYVQLHAMTPEITLFKNGLVASDATSSQPRLPKRFLEMIDRGWTQTQIKGRTRKAIAYLGRFIPAFTDAEVGGPPLFGAQQIPGDDPNLRVAEVSFDLPGYARCEIVKVSSVTDMIRAILADLQNGSRRHAPLDGPLIHVPEEIVAHRAETIARTRGFDPQMSRLLLKEAQA